jgi:hypothetical protein
MGLQWWWTIISLRLKNPEATSLHDNDDVLMHKALQRQVSKRVIQKKLRWTQRLELLMLKRVKNG